MCVEIYLDIHTSSAKQRLRHVLIIFADFTYIYTGELITYYFPDLLQPPSPPQDLEKSPGKILSVKKSLLEMLSTEGYGKSP
jgi:hypothetical protein